MSVGIDVWDDGFTDSWDVLAREYSGDWDDEFAVSHLTLSREYSSDDEREPLDERVSIVQRKAQISLPSQVDTEKIKAAKPERRKKRHRRVASRHHIPSPHDDPEGWGKALRQGRISELFKTKPGLYNHALVVQNELNRAKVKKQEIYDGSVIARITQELRKIKIALEKAKQNATFKLSGEIRLEFPHTHQVIKI